MALTCEDLSPESSIKLKYKTVQDKWKWFFSQYRLGNCWQNSPLFKKKQVESPTWELRPGEGTVTPFFLVYPKYQKLRNSLSHKLNELNIKELSLKSLLSSPCITREVEKFHLSHRKILVEINEHIYVSRRIWRKVYKSEEIKLILWFQVLVNSSPHQISLFANNFCFNYRCNFKVCNVQ